MTNADCGLLNEKRGDHESGVMEKTNPGYFVILYAIRINNTNP